MRGLRCWRFLESTKYKMKTFPLITFLALLLGSGLKLLGNYVRLNYRLLKPGDEE